MTSTAAAADLWVGDAFIANWRGDEVVPRVGERFWLRVNYWYYQPTCDAYVIRRTVDGVVLDHPPSFLGCGLPGVTIWTQSWGTWIFSEPGTYTAEVILDAENGVAETNEQNNRFVFEFDVLPAASQSDVFFEWPVGGAFGRDVVTCSLFDLAGPGLVATHDCGDSAYDDHAGNDLPIGGFEAMDLAPIPVFAAAAGVVIAATDGYDDHNTGCLPDPYSGNTILVDHGGGITTTYGHLQRNSLLVNIDDVVQAGQQIATVGSSGCSYGPHLHFEAQRDGLPFDPAIAPCNPIAWARLERALDRKTSVIPEGYLSTSCVGETPHYYFTPAESTVSATVPFSTIVSGSDVRFEFWQGDWQYGVVNYEDLSEYDCGLYLRACYVRPAQQTGPGFVRVYADSRVVEEIPYLSVDPNFVGPGNSPPFEPVVAFRPPPRSGRVTYAEVTVPAFDPDYEVLRYRYEWFVDGEPVRDVTTLALADALPAGFASRDAEIRCIVTALDALDASSSAEAAEFVVETGDTNGDGVVDLPDLAALLIAFGRSAGDPAYRADTDLRFDDEVDLLDLSEMLRRFAQ